MKPGLYLRTKCVVHWLQINCNFLYISVESIAVVKLTASSVWLFCAYKLVTCIHVLRLKTLVNYKFKTLSTMMFVHRPSLMTSIFLKHCLNIHNYIIENNTKKIIITLFSRFSSCANIINFVIVDFIYFI